MPTTLELPEFLCIQDHKTWASITKKNSKQNLHIIESISIISTMDVKITFFTSLYIRSGAERPQPAGVSHWALIMWCLGVRAGCCFLWPLRKARGNCPDMAAVNCHCSNLGLIVRKCCLREMELGILCF